MNQNFFDTLYLFNSGMRNKEPEINHKINLKEIYKIARSQGIWDTVFLALIKLYKNNKLDISETDFNKLNSDFLLRCMTASKRLIFIHNVIKKLEDRGISCCILKGESVARYYHTPNARISSDADILIDKSKTKECLEFLRNEGFDVEDENYESHQIRCVHPACGLIEIHNRMYGVRTEDVTFNGEIKYEEPHSTFKAFDGTILKTLGTTDNALFLIMHFLKHFISQGVGVRQLADTLFFIENNIERIDFLRLDMHLKNLGFDTVFSYMVEIGKIYFDFQGGYLENKDIDSVLLDKILDDMEKGGLFGMEEDRKGFYDLYLNERYKTFNKGDISSYKNKRKITRLFPGRKFMSINYPYVEKSPVLLPVAWVHRVINNFVKKEEKPIDTKHTERLEFLRNLNMV